MPKRYIEGAGRVFCLVLFCFMVGLCGCSVWPQKSKSRPALPPSAAPLPAEAASASRREEVPPAPSASAPAAAASAPARPLVLALALGGGAARGFAHIGVIQVLEENGIRLDLVTGTSAGSLVAAMLASGKNGRELASLAQAMDEVSLTDWSFPGRGLIRGEALASYVRKVVGNRPMEKMKLPLGIVATDLDSGKPVLFQRGDVGTAVRASSAVPAVFQPVRLGRHEYVDGGLTSPVPVRSAREMGADAVIAVDISQDPSGAPTGDALHMLLQTFSIMGHSIKELELEGADIVIRPRLTGVLGTDFTGRKKSIQAGRAAALAQIEAIKALVAVRR